MYASTLSMLETFGVHGTQHSAYYGMKLYNVAQSLPLGYQALVVVQYAHEVHLQWQWDI